MGLGLGLGLGFGLGCLHDNVVVSGEEDARAPRALGQRAAQPRQKLLRRPAGVGTAAGVPGKGQGWVWGLGL